MKEIIHPSRYLPYTVSVSQQNIVAPIVGQFFVSQDKIDLVIKIKLIDFLVEWLRSLT